MNPVLPPTAIPFSRPFEVARVRDEAVEVAVAAEAAERDALARIDGLVGIDRLEAELRIAREGRSGVRVTGNVRATIRQTCVVSLEAFESDVVEPVEVHFLPEADVIALEAARPKGDDADEGDHDLPDPIVGGRIDLGALAAEFLSLGLDPYPRKPGAAFELSAAEETAPVSPFAALGRLKTDPRV